MRRLIKVYRVTISPDASEARQVLLMDLSRATAERLAAHLNEVNPDIDARVKEVEKWLHVAFIAFAVLAGVLVALTVIANAQSAAELILLGVIIMAYIAYGILWLVGVI